MGARLGDAVSSLYVRYLIPAYHEIVLWLQMVTPSMSGATATIGRDTVRGQSASYADGSFGVGWQITDASGKVRLGYMGGVPLQAAINDRQTIQEVNQGGLTVYEAPIIYLANDPGLSKGDVVVFGAVRFRVADRLKPYEVLGQTVLQRHTLEKHEPNSLIYSIPLT